MKVVRDSKFRHVFGEPDKNRYEDLRLSSKQNESSGICGNSKFIAFPWESGGGSTMCVLPVQKHGRQPRDLPLIAGHTGAVLDFEFNPFDDNMLLTASEDMTLKLWNIPDGGLTSHMKEPMAVLEGGHTKKISFSTFNPTASGIVATSSFDFTTRVWNLEDQEEAFSITMPEVAHHLKWNSIGNLLATTCKDKTLRIIDPRQNSIASEAKTHDGAKASKVAWLGGTSLTDDEFKIVTTGFTAQAERQIGVWDMRKFSGDKTDPMNMILLDQGIGALYPHFDPGTQMLYLAGKGDANVRYFEVTPANPFAHFLSDYRTTVPQKGWDFFPKRCVDVNKHEVMRGLKLENGAVQKISFRVPRKSENFQDDIFPHCPAGVPSMTSDEWVGGSECRPPIYKSMEPGTAQASAGTPATSVVSVKDLKKQLAEAQAKIESLEKENSLLKEEINQLKG